MSLILILSPSILGADDQVPRKVDVTESETGGVSKVKESWVTFLTGYDPMVTREDTTV